MRENENSNFVDDDPEDGPQPLNIWDSYGDDEWDGRFDERYNDDEGAGGIYGFSDDEKTAENEDYCIFKCEEGDSVRDLRRKRRKATLIVLYKDKAIFLGV